MPLLPIDMQTAFAQLNQVGREQAVQRASAPEAQAFQASEIGKRTEERDKAVNESQELGEGIETVKDQEERRRGRRQEERHSKDEGQEERRRNVFRDPDLGHHIDITT